MLLHGKHTLAMKLGECSFAKVYQASCNRTGAVAVAVAVVVVVAVVVGVVVLVVVVVEGCDGISGKGRCINLCSP